MLQEITISCKRNGSGCFEIGYVLKVSSNWQKTSAAHLLLIKCLIDPPYFVDNEVKKKKITQKKL